MLKQFETYLLFFIIYSAYGWCMEVVVQAFRYRRFINRGFLIGPYCPIYGVGGLSIALLLQRYLAHPALLFMMGMFLCLTLEYLTSYIMEKLFHARWWDYSQRKFNLHGRICMSAAIPFGIFGILAMYYANPFLYDKFDQVHMIPKTIICSLFIIFFLVDLCVSTNILSHTREENDPIEKDSSEELAAKVRDIITAKIFDM